MIINPVNLRNAEMYCRLQTDECIKVEWEVLNYNIYNNVKLDNKWIKFCLIYFYLRNI